MNKAQRQKWEYKFNIERFGEPLTETELKAIYKLIGQLVVSDVYEITLDKPCSYSEESEDDDEAIEIDYDFIDTALEVQRGLYDFDLYYRSYQIENSDTQDVLDDEIDEYPDNNEDSVSGASVEVQRGLYVDSYYLDAPELEESVEISNIPTSLPEQPIYTMTGETNVNFQAFRAIGSRALRAYIINPTDWLGRIPKEELGSDEKTRRYLTGVFDHILYGTWPYLLRSNDLFDDIKRYERSIKKRRNQETHLLIDFT